MVRGSDPKVIRVRCGQTSAWSQKRAETGTYLCSIDERTNEDRLLEHDGGRRGGSGGMEVVGGGRRGSVKYRRATGFANPEALGVPA